MNKIKPANKQEVEILKITIPSKFESISHRLEVWQYTDIVMIEVAPGQNIQMEAKDAVAFAKFILKKPRKLNEG